MQIPPAETIPTLPDDTQPGPVPPIGPDKAKPDYEDSPLPEDDPGEAPAFPPEQAPFPDDIEPVDHARSR